VENRAIVENCRGKLLSKIQDGSTPSSRNRLFLEHWEYGDEMVGLQESNPITDECPINVSALSDARFHRAVKGGRELLRAFDKAV
jgi:hypothetical protein